MTAEEILIQIRQRRQQQFDAADLFEKIRIIEQERTRSIDPDHARELRQLLTALKGK